MPEVSGVVIDWGVSIGAVLIALGGAWLGHRLASSRTERDLRAQKIREFKEQFVPFLRALEMRETHAPTLVAENFPEQDAAARKLALYIGWYKRRRFWRKWRLYAAMYQDVSALGPLHLFAAEVDDLSQAVGGTPQASRYILEQTTRRMDELRSIVKEALDVL